jgi:hypothetical protein
LHEAIVVRRRPPSEIGIWTASGLSVFLRQWQKVQEMPWTGLRLRITLRRSQLAVIFVAAAIYHIQLFPSTVPFEELLPC